MSSAMRCNGMHGCLRFHQCAGRRLTCSFMCICVVRKASAEFLQRLPPLIGCLKCANTLDRSLDRWGDQFWSQIYRFCTDPQHKGALTPQALCLGHSLCGDLVQGLCANSAAVREVQCTLEPRHWLRLRTPYHEKESVFQCHTYTRAVV